MVVCRARAVKSLSMTTRFVEAEDQSVGPVVHGSAWTSVLLRRQPRRSTEPSDRPLMTVPWLMERGDRSWPSHDPEGRAAPVRRRATAYQDMWNPRHGRDGGNQSVRGLEDELQPPQPRAKNSAASTSA